MGLMAGLLVGCVNDSGPNDSKQPKPSIEYWFYLVDTVGVEAHHPITSNGGPVTRYTIEPALPVGLTLDSTSGLISGTSSATSEVAEYSVVASGPGGKDTAEFSLVIVSDEGAVALSISFADAPGYLFKKLVYTWTSNVGTDSVLRDTLTQDDGLPIQAMYSQSITRVFGLKPRRSWQVSVSVFDINDSVLFKDSSIAADIRPAEFRYLGRVVSPRYFKYVIKFILPDSIRLTNGGASQKLNVNRLRVAMDGITVCDSVKASGYFAPHSPGHQITVPYVTTGVNHSIEMQVFGVASGWPANQPLFADTITITADDANFASGTFYGRASRSPERLTAYARRVTTASYGPLLPAKPLPKQTTR